MQFRTNLFLKILKVIGFGEEGARQLKNKRWCSYNGSAAFVLNKVNDIPKLKTAIGLARVIGSHNMIITSRY